MSRSAELFRFIEQLRFTDLIDFITVWAIIYGLLKLVRGTRAVQMAVGLLGVGLLYQLSVILGLETLQFVMRNTLLYFGFAILVIFAPEIRSALMRVGSNIRRPFGRASRRQENFEEILLAVTTLSSRKTGALIVLERHVGLQNYIETGVELGARLSYDLLVTIFDSRTTVGLVRLRMKDEIDELTLLIDRVFSRGRDGDARGEHLLAGADEEIDKLFNW